MRPTRQRATIAESAAFALFEALRRASGLCLSPDERVRLTFERAVDSAVQGLAFTAAGDEALECRLDGLPAELGGRLWVHARSEIQGPSLGLYMRRDRPSLECRFAGAGFVEDGDTWLLRERVVFPSHDGRHAKREALVRRLAASWKVPMAGSWLHLARWNDLEAAWTPDAARQLLRAMLILEAARALAPEWLEGVSLP